MSVENKQHIYPVRLEDDLFDIVQFIRRDAQLTRNELVTLLGLSRSKTTKLINELIDLRLLTEAEVGESSGGRKPNLLELNRNFGYVIGIHMGASGANVCLADFKGKIIEWQRTPINIRNKPEQVMDTVFESVFRLLDAHHINHNQILGIGVGVPAPVEKNTNRIVNPATMLGWHDYSISDYCRTHFAESVVKVDNDVALMALGELREGMGKNHENFLMLKIGTGIGCGIVCKGEVYHGTTGIAGHIGHISVDREGPVCHCGLVGCLEKFAAGPAHAEQATRAANAGRSAILSELMEKNGGKLTPEDVGTAAGRGDKVANDIIIESGRVIGDVLATVVSFFNPSLLIVGGGVSNIGPQLLINIHRTILKNSLPLSTQDFSIQKSQMGYHAGMQGSVSLVLDHVLAKV
ncbi:MAG: ROK family transcriptional regulator [Aggregatilineales bacterium]